MMTVTKPNWNLRWSLKRNHPINLNMLSIILLSDFAFKSIRPHLAVPYNYSTPQCRITTQEDYYGQRCGTLLHSYCTGTYTEVTVLILWGNSAVTMEYPHSYSVGVPVWVLQDSIGATSKKQHCYFSVGTSVK